MNQFLFQAAVWLFLALPPLLLAARFIRPKCMPWLLVLPLAVLGAWCAVNAAVFFRFEALGDQLRADGDAPPRELLEQWANDGGQRAFALFFGWLYGLMYLVPWLVIFAVARRIQRYWMAQPVPVEAGRGRKTADS